ncbi:hypothetical protein SCO02_12470 [Staphylococcus ureilyticus]|uniref:Secreted protein n=1 Tax=Staphylococcus ureilyticus TaxID=94138 RepID=A0AB34AHQ9_STAUR|nr:hypothetical protein [Staphylococcus ureilyticus]GEQ02806.1 hypothetical protein SCO02_12470 [Staphylococcus ureilyticus]
MNLIVMKSFTIKFITLNIIYYTITLSHALAMSYNHKVIGTHNSMIYALKMEKVHHILIQCSY